MLKTRSHWTCLTCLNPSGDGTGQRPNITADRRGLRVLNLYAGIGGNRKLWQGCQVTAVEHNLKVAAAYKRLYPEDILIVADAHQYLLKHYKEFDFIWSSPPCPTHSRVNYFISALHRKFPDMKLYQEIIFLEHFFKGKFVVENVYPYYNSLITPTAQISRHIFWANFKITEIEHETPKGFIEMYSADHKKQLQEWLGIYIEKNIYLSAKNALQVFRNCLHPDIGLSIFNDMILSVQAEVRI
jgi:DNA (cytosine-5)-methyltransferase 1